MRTRSSVSINGMWRSPSSGQPSPEGADRIQTLLPVRQENEVRCDPVEPLQLRIGKRLLHQFEILATEWTVLSRQDERRRLDVGEQVHDVDGSEVALRRGVRHG